AEDWDRGNPTAGRCARRLQRLPLSWGRSCADAGHAALINEPARTVPIARVLVETAAGRRRAARGRDSHAMGWGRRTRLRRAGLRAKRRTGSVLACARVISRDAG